MYIYEIGQIGPPATDSRLTLSLSIVSVYFNANFINELVLILISINVINYRPPPLSASIGLRILEGTRPRVVAVAEEEEQHSGPSPPPLKIATLTNSGAAAFSAAGARRSRS